MKASQTQKRDENAGGTAQCQQPGARPFNRQGGFSLVELLMAVSLTTLIILALYNIFSQTQRALRSNVTQVDILESGRAVVEVLARELEELAPSELRNGTNFFALANPFLPPVVQVSPETGQFIRTNSLQEIFFLTQKNNDWVGTGYRVLFADGGVGTLYRFSISTNRLLFNGTNLMQAFFNEPLTNAATGRISTNYARLADGIIHLRLVPYDPLGRRLGWETTNQWPAYQIDRPNQPIPPAPNLVLRKEPSLPDSQFVFLSNAIPGFVELELGVLSPDALKKHLAIREGNAQAAFNFLRNQAAQVHVFEQQIPIRRDSR